MLIYRFLLAPLAPVPALNAQEQAKAKPIYKYGADSQPEEGVPQGKVTSFSITS